jgi:AmmeMemoRadiSam system protein B
MGIANRARTVILVGWVVASATITTACDRSKPRPQPSREKTVMRVREPAVAGSFYPDDPDELAAMVDGYLAEAKARNLPGLRALVCPHAGYIYSGKTAGIGFRQAAGGHFDQVVVMAPSHRVAFRGVAVPAADAFETPLGKIPVSDRADELGKSPPFVVDSRPHAQEHALEVELPFLQRVLKRFELIPLVFGKVDEEAAAAALAKLVNPTTLFVASSDLSHYHAYDQARALDQAAVDAIVRLDIDAIRHAEACGKSPVLALAHLARAQGWKTELLDYRNSGDTAGRRAEVVGYAAIAFFDGKS